MSQTYLLKAVEGPQAESADSFIGGRPKLPPGEAIPVCDLCNAPQTFYFQVAFPADNEWAGLSLATFACTSCADKKLLIPTMLDGPLPGADIPEDFLAAYQINFRFLVFETAKAVLSTAYPEKVAFQRWELVPTDPTTAGNKLGGSPNWLQEDETPASYAGRTPMFFLLQLERAFQFPTVSGAPPQIKIGLSGNPQPANYPYYKLFISNATYLFGTEDRSQPLVYALTQVP
jgi:hypothetical protein